MKSVEVGGRLLHALAQAERAMPLHELAAQARLSPSSAHRYLVSFSRTGLVRQDAVTRLYDIGPFALQFGIAAMGRSKLIARAEEVQRELRARLDESAVLAVWGTFGPVIVNVLESNKPIVMTMRVGATMPLLRTATGWVFAAFMPYGMVKSVMRAEIAAGRGPVEPMNAKAINVRLAEIRKSRFASHLGDLLPGVRAVASPLLDPNGQVVAVLSVFGQNLDPSPTGPAARALKKLTESFAHY